MVTQYEIRMPRVVLGGKSTLASINDILEKEKVQRIAIFTDKVIQKTGLLDTVLANITKEAVELTILNDLPPEPTYGQVEVLAEQCKSFKADFIIAVGGGSVMDSAKLASMLMTDAYRIKDLFSEPLKGKKFIKTVMIPTTIGTGAEATPNAIVAVPEQQLKVGIVNPHMIADYVILDPIMVKNLPRSLAAATGVDALSHAIECWTSNKANPFSDLFALEALDLILANIEQACDEPEAVEAKSNMQLASFYAGVAITSSGTTAVHALSYPLGGTYHIAHGVSNAMLLVPVMTFNEPACRSRLAQAYDHCIGKGAVTEEEKSQAIITRLGEIVRNLDIPTSLADFNVPKEDLESLVKAGMQVTRLLNNNMRKITADDARKIYQGIL